MCAGLRRLQLIAGVVLHDVQVLRYQANSSIMAYLEMPSSHLKAKGSVRSLVHFPRLNFQKLAVRCQRGSPFRA